MSFLLLLIAFLACLPVHETEELLRVGWRLLAALLSVASACLGWVVGEASCIAVTIALAYAIATRLRSLYVRPARAPRV